MRPLILLTFSTSMGLVGSNIGCTLLFGIDRPLPAGDAGADPQDAGVIDDADAGQDVGQDAGQIDNGDGGVLGADPSCQFADPVAVILVDNLREPIQYYEINGNSLLRIVPAGYQAEQTSALPDPSELFSPSKLEGFDLRDQIIWINDSRTIYAISSRTLAPIVEVQGPKLMISPTSSSYDGVVSFSSQIVAFGNKIHSYDAIFPYSQNELGNGNYFSVVPYTKGERLGAIANREDGFTIVINTPFSPSIILQETDASFSAYGDPSFSQGIAFDTQTHTLVVGQRNETYFAQLNETMDEILFAVRLPIPLVDQNDSEVRGRAVAAGNGFAYVFVDKSEGSFQNLLQYDLRVPSQTAPILKKSARWAPNNENLQAPVWATFACDRVILLLSNSNTVNTVRSFDAVSLQEKGAGLNLRDAQHMLIVDKTALQIAE